MGDHRMGVNAPKRPNKAGLADGRGRSPTNSGAILARSAAFLHQACWGARSGRSSLCRGRPREAGSYALDEGPVGVMAELVEQLVRVEGCARLGAPPACASRGVCGTGASFGFARVASPAERTDPCPRDRESILLRPTKARTDFSARDCCGVIHVLTSNFGSTGDEIILDASRMLGLKAASLQIRQASGDSSLWTLAMP